MSSHLRILCVHIGVCLSLLIVLAGMPLTASASSRSSSATTSRLCLQPPQGVDLSTASDKELAQYGLPARSLQRTNQAAQRKNLVAWAYMLKHAKHRSCNTAPPGRQRPLSWKGSQGNHSFDPWWNEPCPPTDAVSTCWSSNWSGAIDHDQTYNLVLGEAQFPCSANDTVGAWFGLGGMYSNSTLVQIVFHGSTSPNGKLVVETEVVASQSRDYHAFFDANALRIQCGDQMGAEVASTPNSPGSDGFFVEDITRGTYDSSADPVFNNSGFVVDHTKRGNPSSPAPVSTWPATDGSSAEWIVERPTLYDNNGNATLPALPNFGTISFTNTYTQTQDGYGGAAGNFDHFEAYMYNGDPNQQGKLLAWASDTTIDPSTSDPSTFSVNWVASS